MTRAKPPYVRARPTQLQFEFMHTVPPQLSPAAARKQYAEYRRSVRDEPDRRNLKHERKDDGTR